MKIGDLVMFIDKGLYSKWFFGRMGTVLSVSSRTNAFEPNNTKHHCRVEWIVPVKYHDGFSHVSDFLQEKFEVLS